MNRYFSYLNTACDIISRYKGQEPFAAFMKKYFAASKKFGSTDRRLISQLCYSYFRLGMAGSERSMETRIEHGLFICATEKSDMLSVLAPGLVEGVGRSIEEKLGLLSLPLEDVFPCIDELSDDIEKDQFISSHFLQPEVYLRLRPGRKTGVVQKLTNAGIAFREMGDSTLAVSPSARIEDNIIMNRDAVVQDLSSQGVGEFLLDQIQQSGRRTEDFRSVWDCCAASGGKSIMAVDLLGRPALTVSDLRETILINLRKRFREAGIGGYRSFVADLGAEEGAKGLPKNIGEFDLIIADVPCSGSGTWGRTPEQLSMFSCEGIAKYAALQERIAGNALPYLRKGGWLLYVTCSVYEQENERQVEKLVSQGLRLIAKKLLKGYDQRADSMFVAVLEK